MLILRVIVLVNEPFLDPVKYLVSDMFYWVIKEIGQDRNNCQTRHSRPPCANTGTRGLGKRFPGLGNGSMDCECWQSPM